MVAKFDNVGSVAVAPPPSSGTALFDNVGATTGVVPILIAPQNLTATPLVNGDILFSWTAVPGATGYQIDVISVTPGFPGLGTTPINATNVQVTGLTGGQTYEFDVVAVNAFLVSPQSTVLATSLATLPGSVGSLAAVAAPDGSITLSWTPATLAASYSVTAAGDDDPFVDYFTDSFGTSETHTATGLGITFSDLVPGRTYTFIVSGVNANGTGPGVDIVATSVVTQPPIIQPTAIPLGASNIVGCTLVELAKTGPYAGMASLSLMPHTGGIYIQALDPGYPVVRESVTSYPDSHGDIDLTQFFAGRAVAVTGVCIDGVDTNSNVQSAAFWLSVLKRWTMLDPTRRIALRYTLRGEAERYILVRPSDLTAPIDYTASGSSRSTIAWQLGYRAADPFIYGVPPVAQSDPADPLSYLYQLPVDNGDTGGIELADSTGINLAGNTGIELNGISSSSRFALSPGYNGFVPAQPIVRIVNNSGISIVAPVITLFSSDGSTIASTIDLSATVSAAQLTIASGQHVEVDIVKKTVLLFTNGAGSSVRKYLTATPPWSTFRISGSPTFHFTTSTGLTTNQAKSVFAQISYRSTFL